MAVTRWDWVLNKHRMLDTEDLVSERMHSFRGHYQLDCLSLVQEAALTCTDVG